MTTYVISGRVHGDDDDTVHFVEAKDDIAAMGVFARHLAPEDTDPSREVYIVTCRTVETSVTERLKEKTIEPTTRGFVEFVRRTAARTPDRKIRHYGYETCAIGDYLRDINFSDMLAGAMHIDRKARVAVAGEPTYRDALCGLVDAGY